MKVLSAKYSIKTTTIGGREKLAKEVRIFESDCEVEARRWSDD